MLPTGSGSGQLFQDNSYLCDLRYELDYPLGFVNVFNVIHVKLFAQDFDLAPLQESTDLCFVLADGTRYHLPQPLEMKAHGCLECTIRMMD